MLVLGRLHGNPTPTTSSSLPPLAPAPSLHPGSSYRPHHLVPHHPPLPPLVLHHGLVRSTVYRNPYDRTGARELADALRTQDDDNTVRQGKPYLTWHISFPGGVHWRGV